MSIRTLAIGLAFAAAVFVSGCGGGEDEGSPTGEEPAGSLYEVSALPTEEVPAGLAAATRQDLAGRTFRLVSADGLKVESGVEPRIEFTPKLISIEVNCNNVGGGYTLNGGVLKTRMASTLMACEPERTDAESALLDFFRKPSEAMIGGEKLLLQNGAQSLLLEEVPATIHELEELVWIKDRTKLIFHGGEYTVLAPCESGTARSLIGAETIDFEGYSIFEYCGDEDQVTGDIVDMLQGPVEYELDGSTLNLTNGESEVELEGITPQELGPLPVG